MTVPDSYDSIVVLLSLKVQMTSWEKRNYSFKVNVCIISALKELITFVSSSLKKERLYYSIFSVI